MSDYGAFLQLTKRDKTPLTDSDKESLQREIEKIKTGAEHIDVLGEMFSFRVMNVHNEPQSVVILLSEYWVGDDDDFEFAKDNDFEQAKIIAEQLKPVLPWAELTAGFENW